MKRIKAAAATAGLLFGVALVGCSQGDAPLSRGDSSLSSRGEGASSHFFSFGTAGARATSHVKKRVAATGGESLEGSTELWPAGASHPMILRETAEIAPSGRLVSATAELRGGARGADLIRSVHLDASRGTVKVADGEGERSWEVPVDHPWMYRALFPETPAASSATAVTAWVARRAAQAGTKVRELEVATRESHLTVPTQIVFEDGARDLVVVGDEVAEADGEFVRALAWKPFSVAAEGAGATSVLCEPDPS